MSPKKILIIDDAPRAAEEIKATLKGRSITVRRHGGPLPDPDMLEGCSAVLLNEESVPNPAGEVKSISACRPDLPLIVYSRRPRVESAVAMLKAGAWDYLSQSVGMPAIGLSVGSILEKNGAPTADLHCGNSDRNRPLARDEAMIRLLERARQVASSNATVLIQGESGTGKEVLAKYIHACSDRADQAFVAVNCAALPEQLAESELFGYEKGAFTGALQRRKGKFEQADGGTLLLDEISEMPLFMQAKLLRALQEREIDRIGGSCPVAVDVRIIATSNRNLEQEVAEGRMRKDLYYRLKVIVFQLPPLCRRKQDIELLANHFLEKMNRRHRKDVRAIAADALEKLLAYNWPGNVRELENTIERAVLLDQDRLLGSDDIVIDGDGKLAGPRLVAETAELKVGMTVEEAEKALIMKTLQHVNQNRTRAARMLGISIRTLRNKINAYRNTDPGQAKAV